MPELQLSPGVNMYYEDDDFTDPWTKPETVFLLHGFSENGKAWNGWVPSMARHFRVIRPDMRGFGRSTPMPMDHQYSVEEILGDFLKLADHLGIKRFHVVGAKVAGALGVRFAANHPDRVLTLTVTGATFVAGQSKPGGAREPGRLEQFEREGVEGWARASMTGRLGSEAPPEMLEYWIQMMGSTARTTAVSFGRTIPATDVSGDLANVKCPALIIVISNERPGLVEATKERVKLIPHGEVAVVEGDSYHVAATHPEECARLTMEFIERSAVKV